MPWLWFLVVLVLLAFALLFMVVPDRGDLSLRTPFAGHNFAHRGLFSQDQSTPENSLPAFAAAAEAGYGIELDVQFTSDRQLIVFHDDTLDRMTGTKGWVRDFSYAQILGMPLAGTEFHAPLFTEMLDVVGGRVPLIIEIKSRHEYNSAYLDALCAATLEQLRGYTGPYCIESFDPRVVQRIRKLAPHVLRGQLVDSFSAYCKEGAHPIHAYAISHCFANFLSRPNFIAWCPAPQNWAVRLCGAFGAMMVYWTALPQDDRPALEHTYDAVIFQWYQPELTYRK